MENRLEKRRLSRSIRKIERRYRKSNLWWNNLSPKRQNFFTKIIEAMTGQPANEVSKRFFKDLYTLGAIKIGRIIEIEGITFIFSPYCGISEKSEKNEKKLLESIAKIENNLSNSEFLKKCPEHVIEDQRKKLEEYKKKLKQYESING